MKWETQFTLSCSRSLSCVHCVYHSIGRWLHRNSLTVIVRRRFSLSRSLAICQTRNCFSCVHTRSFVRSFASFDNLKIRKQASSRQIAINWIKNWMRFNWLVRCVFVDEHRMNCGPVKNRRIYILLHSSTDVIRVLCTKLRSTRFFLFLCVCSNALVLIC